MIGSLSGQVAGMARANVPEQTPTPRNERAIGQQAKMVVAAARDAAIELPKNAQGIAASGIARGADPASLFAVQVGESENLPADETAMVAVMGELDAEIGDEVDIDRTNDEIAPEPLNLPTESFETAPDPSSGATQAILEAMKALSADGPDSGFDRLA